MRSLPWLALVFWVCVLSIASFGAERAARPSEIIVSAANYAETPPAELSKIFRRPVDLPDPTPPTGAARAVKFYQFLPGEGLESDLSYREVCALLVPALAQKNFQNTFEEAKVELVLRITFGGRSWRDPFVRSDHLEWKHGLVPRRRGTAFGAGNAWDARAGGDEASLRDTERTLSEMGPANGAEGMADRLIGGMPTEDYFLVVVDAFAVADLRAKGNAATRAWTTFIAVPRQAGRKFSDLAPAMIAKAAPYFGETLSGKARFTDRSGTVTIGEARVVEDPPAEKK